MNEPCSRRLPGYPRTTGVSYGKSADWWMMSAASAQR